MDRASFHRHFDAPGPVVFPVIHVLDTAQTERNLRIVEEAGAAGAFLINHDFPVEAFLPILREVRARFPTLWIGVNFLAVTGREAFPILGALQSEGARFDAYWADDACIDEGRPPNEQTAAEEIAAARKASGWQGLYFGGTAFKKQRVVSPEDYGRSAEIAAGCMDVVTTSGVATGEEADMGKIRAFRQAIGGGSLALASGVTPENAARYGSAVDAILVATGINHEDDFYNIDPVRLADLMTVCRALGKRDGGGL